MQHIWIIEGTDMAFLSKGDVKAFQEKANSAPDKYGYVDDYDIKCLTVYDASGEPR